MCLQVRASHYSGLLSPSFIFSCTTTASIFQMQISNALLVTAVHEVKMILGDNILKYWEAFTWKDKTSDNKLSNCCLYFTALQYINNLETKRSYKRTVNLDSYFFLKIYRTVSKLFANLLKYTEMFTEPLTIVPWYIRIITFFPSIGWSYLHDLSHMFFKRLRLHVKSASFSTDNNRTSGLSIFYRISSHKNFFPKYLDNALTDFA